MSALPPKADILHPRDLDVRFGPEGEIQGVYRSKPVGVGPIALSSLFVYTSGHRPYAMRSFRLNRELQLEPLGWVVVY